MKANWTQDEAQFHGHFVDFDPIWSWPKPVQKPHPPILVGGDGLHTLQRVAEYGDGWMPIAGRGHSSLSERMADLNRLATEAGRGHIPVSIYGAPARAEVIQHYADLGVERCIFWLPPAPREQIIPILDSYAELVNRFA